jgi:hypothetical protein
MFTEVTEKSPNFSHFLEKKFPKSPQIAKRKNTANMDAAIHLLTEGRSSRLEGQCAAANFQGKEEIAWPMGKLQVRL